MKSREHVVTNGRAVFYACLWEDFRKSALDCGWALGLHGSLSSDMDIMAMPWTEDATTADIMIDKLNDCFDKPEGIHWMVKKDAVTKKNNRVVYTIPIWSDFYLDINVIEI